MKSGSNQLPEISKQMIEEALVLIQRYMNQIEEYYRDTEIGYEYFATPSDGEALVAILRCGLRYEELMQNEIIPSDDECYGQWYDA